MMQCDNNTGSSLYLLEEINSTKVRIPYGVIDMAIKKWLNKAICEGKNVVEVMGCYSNFAVLDELERAMKIISA